MARHHLSLCPKKPTYPFCLSASPCFAGIATEANAFPTLESLGRDRDLNIENFKIFCEKLLSVAVGRRKFKEGRCTKRISKFCSISNEAFIIVSVENSYDRWKWEWTNQQAAGAADGPTMPPKKYTQNPSASKKYRGWTAEGIARYNELITEVKLDRKDKDRKNLEEQYLANAMTARNLDGGSRKRKVDWMDDPNEANLALKIEYDSDTEEEDSDDDDDSEEREGGGDLFLPPTAPRTTRQLTTEATQTAEM